MSVVLRVLLMCVAVLSFVFVIRKLSKAQFKLMDALFWIVFSTILLVLGIFPNLGISLAEALGVLSAANFVFLVVIFLLIMVSFSQSIRIASLEAKITNLVQELAIDEKNKEERTET